MSLQNHPQQSTSSSSPYHQRSITSLSTLPQTNNRSNIWSVSLQELPIRPSILQLLIHRGFETTRDIYESRYSIGHGGISNFASELDVTLQEASTIFQEIQGCLYNNDDTTLTNTNNNNNNNNNSDNSIVTAYDLLHMYDSRSRHKSSYTSSSSSSSHLILEGINILLHSVKQLIIY